MASIFGRFRKSSLVALGLALVLGLGAALTRAADRDFVFFQSSDPHIGSADKKANPPITQDQWAADAAANLKQMLAVIGQPYPTVGPLHDVPPATVAKPRGFIIAGDLTDALDWPRFETIFPPAGFDNGTIPLFLCIGNHDGSPKGATRLGVLAANRRLQKEGRLAAISDNGLHYAWNWDGVHFVCVNLYPADKTDPETPFQYGKPGDGSWNDPMGALTFLTDYLKKNVGNSGQPVIIWQHYGYCEGFNFDWNWWSAKLRRTFYDAVKDYNIVALLHGHTHLAAHYRWPDLKEDPKEVNRLFGEAVPQDLKSFDVFSGGSVGNDTMYVFRILNDQLIAAHHGPQGWSKDASLDVVKSIAAPAKTAAAQPATKQTFKLEIGK